MNPAWSERSIEDQSLFNPVFCALLLRTACRGYQEGDGAARALPLAHCFLILPIVLNAAMRSALPTLRTRMTTWITSHPEHIGDFADRSRELVYATREAIQLGCAQEWLAIAGDGVRPGPHRFRPDPPRLATDTVDIRDCYEAARFVGRWLPKNDRQSTILSMLGVTT
ncbi:three component ABC system middle component [Sphingomonas hengshuiensis]|uniref:three component ABC system middle component n=1 Tax=Sphingomonas hengshuiensis TaxID=1609977 RepID=UPI000AEF7CE5|nr:three component ABC system middle component [Sphingomonas hengshuiensis]